MPAAATRTSGVFAPPPPALGQRGSYELIEELARTSTEIAYLAVQRGQAASGRMVVVREPAPERREDPDFVAEFISRARIVARLAHPQIVPVIEVQANRERPFFSSEYVDGQTLEVLVQRAQKRAARVSLPMFIRVVIDVLSALEHAHGATYVDGAPRGVVHGDIRPASVLVAYDGQIKLIDFRLGNAAQERNAVTDPRADLFQVGILLWEAVVGASPWEDLPSDAPVPRVADAWPDVDPSLAAVVDRAVSLEASERYASALELREDLEHYVRARHVALPSTESLGALVSRLFAEDRCARRNLIESHLGTVAVEAPARGAEPALEESAVSISVVEECDSLGFETGPRTGWPAEPVPASSEEPAVLSVPPPGTGRSTMPIFVAVAATLGALLAIWTFGPRRPHTDPSVQPPAPPAAAIPVQSATTIEAQRTSHVVVIATPRSAQLYLDDVPVANPYVADTPRDATPHSLRVEAAGYEPTTRTIAFGQDLGLEIALGALEAERPAATRARRAPSPTASAAPSCQPPYVIDEATGKKRWRLECL